MIDYLPAKAFESDIAVLGKKGRGKTFTAKGIVEHLLENGHRALIIDPLSVWWGLRLDADGESSGYNVAIFGGPKADININDEMGEQLARIIAHENLPAVIDASDMCRAEQNRLLIDLFDTLLTENRQALTIVLEEADIYAPQNPMKGSDQAKLLHEVDRIARRGRAYGFRLISITQRPARLHKDVLTQLSTLIYDSATQC